MNFSEEYKKLRKKFPEEPQVSLSVENCGYGDQVFDSKNSYYIFDASECQ
jgi:hypothetical protein